MNSCFDLDLNDIKFKPLSKERLIISFDRLTRFKHPEEKYTRVFRDILISNLLAPKYKKSDFDKMDYNVLKTIAEYIINESLKQIVPQYFESDFYINYLLFTFENAVFHINEKVGVLLDNKINYSAFISILEEDDDLPINLKWLKLISVSEEPILDSYNSGFRYPIKKLVLCEGITEEILIPVFANLLGYDFDKNGVQIISAGGKNPVVKLFYKLADELKIPIFILLDSDADINKEEISPKLRKSDKIYLLKNGEFEDNLPLHLIEKALKYSIKNISEVPKDEDDTELSEGMVNYLEHFYKNRGVHEFKKSEFAYIVKENISGVEDISDEFKNVILEIKNL